MRSVAENTKADMAIGNLIAATDEDVDILLYSIAASADADCFSIDTRSGQLKAAKELDYETPATPCITGGTGREADGNTYSIQVTAEDPSLATERPCG